MKSVFGRAVRGLILSVVATAALAPAAVRADDSSLYSSGEMEEMREHSAPGRVPADPTNHVADDPRAAALGQFLFFDKNLSINGQFSCSSCHEPEKAFTDGRPVAKALGVGTRNVPTLINAADNHWFFWDGRADSLWSQVLQVTENPREFGADRLFLAHVVYDDAVLRQAYEDIFGSLPPLDDTKRFPAHARPTAPPKSPQADTWQGMSAADQEAVNRVFSNLGKAIAAYERFLINRDAPFDRYARALRMGDIGGQAAYPEAAKRGFKLFVGRAECDLCHSGPDFTDGQFHNVGLPVQPGEAPDPGRQDGLRQVLADPFNAAGIYSDAPHSRNAKRLEFLPKPKDKLGAFKTPSLRNVARTAPYLHDGRFATLEEVIQFYADGKAASKGKLVGKRERTLDLIPHLTKHEISDLVAFLKTLDSAPLPESLTTPPAQP